VTGPQGFIFDTTGRAYGGEVTIEIMPGIGVTGPKGEHLDRENGPHTVSMAFAVPLLSSNRARRVDPSAAPAVDPEAQVRGAPAGVQQRDPKARTR
jgi:hypothetical protein